MNIELRSEKGALVVRILDRRIDAAGTAELKARVGNRIDEGDHRVVLDLGEVELLDSTGLGGLISLLKKLPPAGSLVLCGCRPPVAELIRLTRLDRIFKTFGSQAEALASL